jgi:hypothetical protein
LAPGTRGLAQQRAVVVREPADDVVEVLRRHDLRQRREHGADVALGVGDADPLALGHAADELVGVEGLEVAAAGEQPGAQRLGQVARQLARLAPGQALAERLEHGLGGLDGLLGPGSRLAADGRDEPFLRGGPRGRHP